VVIKIIGNEPPERAVVQVENLCNRNFNMTLSKFNLKNIRQHSMVPDGVFDLPEKVLQFGTGVLLRGLPDYYIDKANRQGIFNGRIVVVKSTAGGEISAFEKQDGLYTLCMRGLKKGKAISEDVICSAISRVLSAKEEWSAVLKCAHNPDMQIIISNTTEVGIELVKEDIHNQPPVSFPGKLLAFLYERYKAFDGSSQCGMVIVPTELVSDNGKKLEAIVFELAHLNGLEENFIEWLEKHNQFCNSLVDRIVPGKPEPGTFKLLEATLGYKDELLIMSEVYSLWAIEGNETVASVLNFAEADKSIVITPDITVHKELKLRLLNGVHILTCGVAFLAGFHTVKEAMQNPLLLNFVGELMKEEIAKSIPCKASVEEAVSYATEVEYRFCNSSIEHRWLSISVNYSAKMAMRVVPVLVRYYELFGVVPNKLALGFAAYLVFMKSEKNEDGTYFGTVGGNKYAIKDAEAAYLAEQWKSYSLSQLVENVLSNTVIWGTDLTAITGFAEKVTANAKDILQYGVVNIMQNEKVKI
jgi:tagaturonate reductase